MWYYFLMQLLGEQRAADTSSVLLWSCLQNAQRFLFGFSPRTTLLHFDRVVYWFAFLDASGEFFSENIFVHVYFLYNRLKENCLIKMFLNKCFLTWLLTWAFLVGTISSVCHTLLLFPCAYKTQHLLSVFQVYLPRFHSWVWGPVILPILSPQWHLMSILTCVRNI